MQKERAAHQKAREGRGEKGRLARGQRARLYRKRPSPAVRQAGFRTDGREPTITLGTVVNRPSSIPKR